MTLQDDRNSSLRPGDALRHYRIIRMIGAGGMGIVYEAQHDTLAYPVAIKQFAIQPLPDHLSSQERTIQQSALEAFISEARVLINLDHDQIPADGADVPKVYDLFEEGDTWYLVMEYISGNTLDDILRDRGQPLPATNVVAWGEALLKTLAVLHAQEPPIVHRDIKPSNVKRNEDGRIVLLDFGLAKGGAIAASERTSSTSQFVSAYYSPPEQMRGKGTDPRSDYYSLAATLYYLLTGTRPLDAQERVNIIMLDRQPDPLPLASDLSPAVPRYVATALYQAMAIKPDQRFANADAFRQALSDPWGQASDITGVLHAEPSRPRRATREVVPLVSVADPKEATGPRALRIPITPSAPAIKQKREIPWRGVGLVVLVVAALGLAIGAWQTLSFPSALAQTAISDGGSSTVTPTPVVRDSEVAVVAVAPTFTPSGLPTLLAVTTPDPDAPLSAAATSTRLATYTRVVTPSATGSATATATPTSGTTATATTSATTPTATVLTTPTATVAVPVNGNSTVLTFEGCGSWRRGNETWGTFGCSGAQTNSGSSAGELRYDFTPATNDNDYLVFQQRQSIAGQPRSLTLMVYGDGSGHFLNVWIRDNDGDVWQMPLGTVSHTGWRRMNGALDAAQQWPWTRVSGSGDGAITYPITFEAIVLDGHPERSQRSGTIYVDDLQATSDIAYPVFGGGASSPPPVVVNPTATTVAPNAPTPAPSLPNGTPTQPVLPTVPPTPTSVPPTPTPSVAMRPPIVVKDIPPWSQISVNDLITFSWTGGGGFLGPGDSAYIRVFQNGNFARNIIIPAKEWEQGFFPIKGYQITGGPELFGRFTLFLEIVDLNGVSLTQSQTFDYEVGP